MRMVRTDRSRVETAQRCMRQRYLEYHQDGIGIVSAKKPLPLAVGGSVHEGLAVLLREGQAAFDQYGSFDAIPVALLRDIEDRAVALALEDFSKHSIALDTAEEAAMTTSLAAAAEEQTLLEQLVGSVEKLRKPQQ